LSSFLMLSKSLIKTEENRPKQIKKILTKIQNKDYNNLIEPNLIYDFSKSKLNTDTKRMPHTNQQDVRENTSDYRSVDTCPLTLISPRLCPFGGACHTCPTSIQTKLTIDQSNDPRESNKEKEVLPQMPENLAFVNTRDSGQNHSTPLFPIILEVLHSSGQSLNPETRAFMESRFGHDFSQVRVHNDAKASESAIRMNALAYTVGRDVVFRVGKYESETNEGRWLLAHELTHVVQQRNAISDPMNLFVDISPERMYEREASEIADKIILDQPISVNQGLSSFKIQKQVLVEEPAGGCGICYDPQTSGNLAHRLIQGEFVILNPFNITEFPVSSPTDENGRLDLVVATPSGLEIGEIKPASAKQYLNGLSDLAFYSSALHAVYPKSTIKPLTRIIPLSIIFLNPQVPECQLQTLKVNPPIDGVYGYYCSPTRNELVKDQNCQCGGRRRVPLPVPMPEPVRRSSLEKIRAFIRRVVQSGAEAEEAARSFLAENPEVRNLFYGTAIAIVVSTLIEDIATLGAGILDDPASIAVAAALVRVAQAAP
jgi:hypothetical protein